MQQQAVSLNALAALAATSSDTELPNATAAELEEAAASYASGLAGRLFGEPEVEHRAGIARCVRGGGG